VSKRELQRCCLDGDVVPVRMSVMRATLALISGGAFWYSKWVPPARMPQL
jgi:hypothetical protein